MHINLEITLAHDGRNWVARHPLFECAAETLKEIDQQITSIVCNSAEFKEHRSVQVFMGFDYDTIPTWLRQYHTHYFNRILNINNN